MTLQPPSVKARILIVDDVSENLHTMLNILGDQYAVVAATNGEKALELAMGASPPELILLDVMMPGLDGYEVCRRLKRSPATSNIPVIFVTARSEDQDEEYGLLLGAVDYISKPLNPAIVLARVRNHINLKLAMNLLASQAMLDGLTNIPNRRCFDETLASEWKRTLRSGLPLALIIADIDFFKHYNDHYGHGMGDECLRKVADSFRNCLYRPADLAARYGGEEFAAILPETGASGARVVADRIRAGVESMRIPHDYSGVSRFVTISVGTASVIPHAAMSRADLLKLADDRLYMAKGHGRNQVC